MTAYTDGGAGTLYALNPATGAVEHQLAIGAGLPHFSSLALSGGSAFVGTLTGVTAVNGGLMPARARRGGGREGEAAPVRSDHGVGFDDRW